MIPAILALAELVPAVAGLFTDKKHAHKAAQIAATVGTVAKAITGCGTEDDALGVLRTNPELLLKYQTAINEHAATMFAASADVVQTEMKGESWLQRNWRPVTMLTFVGLIVARWLGLTAPNLTPEVELYVMSLIKVGLGGYVIGRSAEKIVKSLPPGLLRGR